MNKPTIPALENTTTPVMDGTATVGTATTASKSDHKHPSDTSRDISVRVTNSAVQALTSNAAFTWNTLDHEIGSSALWDAGQPTRLVAPIAGTYIITACIATETDSVAAITIRKNGVTSVHNSNCPRFWSGSGSITAIARLAANDYIEALWGGGSLNSIIEAGRHYFAMALV